MEDLKLLVRAADDEADQVPFGTESEDEGKEGDGEETCSHCERRAAHVPSGAIVGGLSEGPYCGHERILSAPSRCGTELFHSLPMKSQKTVIKEMTPTVGKCIHPIALG